MFAKWFEEYLKTSQKFRYVPRVSALLISVFSILSLSEIVSVIFDDSEILNITTDRVITAILFQILLILLFSLIFLLTFFASRKNQIYATIFSFTSFLSVICYFLISRFFSYGKFYKPVDEGFSFDMYSSNFLHSTNALAISLIFYITFFLPFQAVKFLLAYYKSR